MRASVVIPVYNQEESLSITLHAFTNQNLDEGDIFNIIVVDDGSLISPIKTIEKYPQLDINLVTKKNSGRASARNAGTKEATYELLIFCDSDRFPNATFVSDHIRLHRKTEKTIGIGNIGEIYTKDLESVSKNIMINTDYYDKRKRIPFYPRNILKIYDSVGLTDSAMPWISTFSGNMSVMKSFFDYCGCYDENFKSWGFEHFDLGFRLYQNGGDFVFNKSLNFHIAHLRKFDEMEKGISNSIEYMQTKYNDSIVKSFELFMLGKVSLQEIEPNRKASWLGREESPIYFKFGSL